MTTTDLLNAIDARIAAKHLLTHPFYQAWTRGELSIEALQDYARQYYQHVAAFPTYLSAVHSHTQDPPTRRCLLQNLIDEEAGSPNHPELWLDFAAGLGVSKEEATHAAVWPETRQLIDRFAAICRDRSTAEGLAALYAYESQIPPVAEAKISGLKRHYGITDPQGYAYFTVHQEADLAHSAAERALLESWVSDSNAAAVNTSVDQVLDSLWEMLSGVCRHHNISEC